MRISEQDLLAASCVCRRWRDVLTSSPRLWTNFQCVDMARTRQYLALSEPLLINVTTRFYSDVRTVIALGPATHRFESLELRLQPSDLCQVLHRLTAPAPALERLEVYATSFPEGRPSINPSIPSVFLGGSTPALRSLHLQGINANLNFSDFPALTHLILTTNDQIFDMPELFRLFASARLLEEIYVVFSGPTTPIPGSQDVIQLPRLRKLSFSNRVREFPGRLLFLLDMPSVEEVKLDISLSGGDMRTIRDFLPSRPWNFPRISKADNLRLGVPHAHCNVQISGPGGLISINASRRGKINESDGFQSYWLSSLGPLSIADARELTLCNYHPEQSPDQCPVLKLLRTIIGLRSLVVERCDSTAIIEALSPTTEGGVLFPYLESLLFQLTAEPKTVCLGLVDMVRQRTQAGFPLNKIPSDECTTFLRTDIDAVRHHVDCIQLDTGAYQHPGKSVDGSSNSCNVAMVRSFVFAGLRTAHR
jgi:hypothetical protein